MPRALFVPAPLRGGVVERQGVAVRNVAARRLVDALLADECAAPFKVLPDPYLHAEYYRVIARPVALADVRDWAVSRPRYSLADACRDLRRMVSRCAPLPPLSLSRARALITTTSARGRSCASRLPARRWPTPSGTTRRRAASTRRR